MDLFFIFYNVKINLVIILTIKEILKISIEKLKKEQIEDAILKAKIIVATVLEQRKEHLLINENKNINEEQVNIISRICIEGTVALSN